MFKSFTKIRFGGLVLVAALFAGLAFGLAHAAKSWGLSINGRPSHIQIHVMNNMYYVSLADLAQLSGWKVTIDLGARNILVITPSASSMLQNQSGLSSPKQGASSHEVAAADPGRPRVGAAPAQKEIVESGIEVGSDTAGPPNNVRMTVKAALSSLDEIRKALDSGAPSDLLKRKRESTAGIVQQAENLLWSLPRTRTLQADIQVALEDLQSQVNLALVSDQAKEGLLPWTHPVAQNLLLKYPDLHPCRVQKGSTDGLDIACARKMMSDLSSEDFNDVERDLDQYR